MKPTLRMLFIFLLMGIGAIAQNTKLIKVTGLVFDKKTAKPLSGVSVSVPHSRTKRLTDKDGFFSINVLAKDTVKFSYTGFKSQFIFMAHHDVASVYDTYVIMSTEASQLKEITIYPRKPKTEAELRQAFLDLKVDDKDQSLAQRNLQLITYEALSNPVASEKRSPLLNDPVKQQSRAVEYKGQYSPDQMIDILGLVKLLIAIKEGDYKAKTYQDFKNAEPVK